MSLREEEQRVTPAVAKAVGVAVDELADIFLLETIRGFGPQKFRQLFEAHLAPRDVLADRGPDAVEHSPAVMDDD